MKLLYRPYMWVEKLLHGLNNYFFPLLVFFLYGKSYKIRCLNKYEWAFQKRVRQFLSLWWFSFFSELLFGKRLGSLLPIFLCFLWYQLFISFVILFTIFFIYFYFLWSDIPTQPLQFIFCEYLSVPFKIHIWYLKSSTFM